MEYILTSIVLKTLLLLFSSHCHLLLFLWRNHPYKISVRQVSFPPLVRKHILFFVKCFWLIFLSIPNRLTKLHFINDITSSPGRTIHWAPCTLSSAVILITNRRNSNRAPSHLVHLHKQSTKNYFENSYFNLITRIANVHAKFNPSQNANTLLDFLCMPRLGNIYSDVQRDLFDLFLACMCSVIQPHRHHPLCILTMKLSLPGCLRNVSKSTRMCSVDKVSRGIVLPIRTILLV